MARNLEASDGAPSVQPQETGPWDPALSQLQRMGPGLGRDLREDDHQPVDRRRSAAQVHRVGQRWL